MDSASLGAAASTLASLLVILLVLAAAGWALRRLRGGALGARLAGPASPISLIVTKPLGGQHSLVIAEAEGQRFLIGVSRGGITAIGRLERQP